MQFHPINCGCCFLKGSKVISCNSPTLGTADINGKRLDGELPGVDLTEFVLVPSWYRLIAGEALTAAF